MTKVEDIMKSIIILLQLALLIFFLLLLRFFLQRVRLLVSLKWFARKYGFRVRGFRPIFFLPLNATKKNMITLETDNYIYDIKPFGLLRKHCEIHFWSLSEYSMEWYFSRHGIDHEPRLNIGATNERKRRRIGAFEADVNANAGKEHTPVLLLSPSNAPIRLTYYKANPHYDLLCADLYAGNMIENAIFADLDYLYRHICKLESKDI